jgi:anion-transporting  ArsA/GET3 family ATPase
VILGTGGVGKTTFAAAVGVGQARHRRTLVLTVDPARRLRDALGTATGMEGSPAIDVLDVHETMQRMVRYLAPDEETATRILENRFFRFIDRRLPGIHHYSGIFRVLEALDEGGFDVVVVDTPPMGHAIEFLTAADRIVRVGRLLGAVAGTGARRFSLRHGLPRLVARTLRRFLGGDFAEDLFEFFDLMHRVLVRFDEKALSGRALLSSDDAALLVVSAPDRDAAGDTERLLEDLPEGHRIQAEILNRVMPAMDEDPEEAAERLLSAMECMPGAKLWLPSSARDLRRSVSRSLRWYQALHSAQQRQIKSTLERAGGLGIPAVLRVPVVAEGLESAEGLRALYDAAKPC